MFTICLQFVNSIFLITIHNKKKKKTEGNSMNRNTSDCVCYVMRHAGTYMLNQCIVTCNTIELKFMYDITFFITCTDRYFYLYEIDGAVYSYGPFSSPSDVWERMCAEHGCLRGGGENERR